jgi:hypothetical protein
MRMQEIHFDIFISFNFMNPLYLLINFLCILTMNDEWQDFSQAHIYVHSSFNKLVSLSPSLSLSLSLSLYIYIYIYIHTYTHTHTRICRSQWPRGLRRGSTAARLLGLWVRIPPRARMSVCCECCVLSGRGLCDGVITRPEESYRLWCA